MGESFCHSTFLQIINCAILKSSYAGNQRINSSLIFLVTSSSWNVLVTHHFQVKDVCVAVYYFTFAQVDRFQVRTYQCPVFRFFSFRGNIS